MAALGLVLATSSRGGGVYLGPAAFFQPRGSSCSAHCGCSLVRQSSAHGAVDATKDAQKKKKKTRPDAGPSQRGRARQEPAGPSAVEEVRLEEASACLRMEMR